MIRTEFTIRATLEEVDGLSRSLADLARPCLPAEKLVGLEIAVAEALNNVVLHGYKGREGTISAALVIRDAAVTVEIRDRGQRVPEGALAAARSLDDLDPLVESGRGLGLIVGLSDRLDYASGPDGNRLTLEFDRQGAAA